MKAKKMKFTEEMIFEALSRLTTWRWKQLSEVTGERDFTCCIDEFYFTTSDINHFLKEKTTTKLNAFLQALYEAGVIRKSSTRYALVDVEQRLLKFV